MLTRRTLTFLLSACATMPFVHAAERTSPFRKNNPPGKKSAMNPRFAYDIDMLHEQITEGGERDHGWCFGLPPGITPERWPLDPANGWPLLHGFTLLLPEDYRVHGPEIVALSFFATAPDHNDGMPLIARPIRDAMASEAVPDTAALRPFHEAARRQDPRLFRMKDILDCNYAVILLTAEEFAGPFCRPVPLPRPLLENDIAAPKWLTRGAAASTWESTYHPRSSLAKEEYFLYRLLGGVPENTLEFNRAIRWSKRANDPNAGKAPRESFDGEPTTTGYQQPYYYEGGEISAETYREHEWTRDHKAYHIGGTMRPAQNVPDFSPFYIEFDEFFGGYNFGGGIGQLDFNDMKFDWAQ